MEAIWREQLEAQVVARLGQTGYCFDFSLEGRRETLSSIPYYCWQDSAWTNKGKWVWAELGEREQTFATSQHVGSERF